jgi:hypothetical protein
MLAALATPTENPPDAIAIIIITFQNAGQIAGCLQSLIKAEPRRRLHLFIVDNASTDHTVEIIRETITGLSTPRLVVDFVVNADNLGFTRAVNQGLQRCAAAWGGYHLPVLFLNPDTILPENSLSTLLEKLYALPATGVIAPQLIHPDGSIQPSCRRFPRHWDLFCELTGLSRLLPGSKIFNRWKMGDFDHRSAIEVDQPQGACLLTRPQVVAQIGLWDERFPLFFSDVDWCRRVWEKGWQIRFEPSVQIIHAQGTSVRQVQPAAIRSSHLSFWRYFRKYERSGGEKILNVIWGAVLIIAAIMRVVFYFVRNLVVNKS